MKNGNYILVVAPKNYPGKKYRDKYAYEHHVVYWKKHKILVNKGEVIHHKNGIKTDNRLANLELLSAKNHSNHHNRVAPIELECSNCQKKIFKKSSEFDFRTKNGQLFWFCSNQCQAIYQHKLGGKLRF